MDNLLEKIYYLKWCEYKSNPVIYPPPLSPVIADPTFLPPNRTPDKRWHLFAHSIFGIHHFVSTDGRGPHDSIPRNNKRRLEKDDYL